MTLERLSLAAFLLLHLNYRSLLDNIRSLTGIKCEFSFLLLKLDLDLAAVLLLKALHKSCRIWNSVSRRLKALSGNAFEHEGGCSSPQNASTLPSSFRVLKSLNFSETAAVQS